LHSAVKGCFKDRNPKFKETIDKLIELDADSTIKEHALNITAQQFAMEKLKDAFGKYDSEDYDDLRDKFESCDECVKKKEEFAKENENGYTNFKYWTNFRTIFSECNECFQNFKDELRCYHSTW
jgi:hypothetical protein